MTRDISPFGLRMPPDLREEVSRHADGNHRSLNAEIVARLEASLVGCSPNELVVVAAGGGVRVLRDHVQAERNAAAKARNEATLGQPQENGQSLQGRLRERIEALTAEQQRALLAFLERL